MRAGRQHQAAAGASRPGARRRPRTVRPRSNAAPARALQAAGSAQAVDAAALESFPPADLPAYPTSVRQLLRELRTQTDALQRAQWELEATQRLLYTSQEQLLQKQQQMEEMRKAQPSLFTAIAASGAAAAGVLGGVRAYLDSGMRKVGAAVLARPACGLGLLRARWACTLPAAGRAALARALLPPRKPCTQHALQAAPQGSGDALCAGPSASPPLRRLSWSAGAPTRCWRQR